MNKYLIKGKKWFDKINGNTYHTVQITKITPKENKIIYESPYICYGYGEQWKQTAYDELIKLKEVKKEDRYNHAKNLKRFIYSIEENCLKRELMRW